MRRAPGILDQTIEPRIDALTSAGYDSAMDDSLTPICRRCGQHVSVNAEFYEAFEQMHQVCFHYTFEHRDDPDEECGAGGCPAGGLSAASFAARVGGVDLSQTGNTVVPAILALRELGMSIEQNAGGFLARSGSATFYAEDPVAVLGLVKLAEIRRPWSATDQEMDDILAEFDL